MKTVGYVATCALSLAIGIGIGIGAYVHSAHDLLNAPAPHVAYTLLDGTPGNTAALQGKVVMVNFWATTCAVCIQEMPQMVTTHNMFRARGLHTLAVAMSYDPPAFVVDFAQRKQLPFSVVIDNTGSVARSYGDIQGTPTTLLINRQGRIVQRYVGAPDFQALQRRIDGLLKES
jgi:peroxiredoxin